MNNLLECHCIEIVLTPRALQYLQGHYRDCLCQQCLQAVRDLFPAAEAAAYP